MNKVQVTIYGRQALVDADQVRLVLKKEALVNQAIELKSRACTLSAYEHMMQSGEITSKIIRLNRRIRNTVQFI